MKKKKSSSIVVRLRMAFLMPFAAFILIVISILGFQYRKRAMNDIVSQLTYEDETVEFSPFISLKDGSVDIGERGLDLTQDASAQQPEQ